MTVPSPLPLPLLLLSSGSPEARALSRGVSAGTHIRVMRGAYVTATDWRALDARGRHRVTIAANARIRPDEVFSHRSAAVLHGFALIGSLPTEVHVTATPATGGRSEVGIVRHCASLGPDDITMVGGIRVTSVVRTVLDLARTDSFREATVVVDHALRAGIPRDLLRDGLGQPGSRGVAKAAAVVAFGDARSANPGESMSRATIHELGFIRPELQVRHDLRSGATYWTDFEWPGIRMIGESDGEGKYLKREYLGTMSPGDAVMAEKRREDELRADGFGFVRWGWDDAWRRIPLRDKLVHAGVPFRRGR